MATSDRKACCFTCNKENGRVTCEGCSKIFCLNHFNDHRQELSKELDEVEVLRDLFRQSLTEKISEAQNHVLLQEVNDWEYQSIDKIRHAAEKAREILRKHTTGINTQLEDKLKILTDQLRQSREENEFFELEINQWKEEITQMKNELVKPPNVTIRHDPTPLVTKITIDISGDTHNIIPKRTILKITEGTNTTKRLVSCSFCNEEHPPTTIGHHLMMCGNKTDQCPNCKKYIRRAVYAYHSENQCANPDEYDADVKPDVLRTFKTNHSSRPASESATENNQDTSLMGFDSALHPKSQTTTSRQSELERTTVLCPNINIRPPPWFDPTAPQNSDEQIHVDERHCDVNIPCENCNESVIISNFDAHMNTCIARNHQRTKEPAERANQMDNDPLTRCRYCHYQYTTSNMEEHESFCLQNPADVAPPRGYISCLRRSAKYK